MAASEPNVACSVAASDLLSGRTCVHARAYVLEVHACTRVCMHACAYVCMHVERAHQRKALDGLLTH